MPLSRRMVQQHLGQERHFESSTGVSKAADLALEASCLGNCEGALLWTVEKVTPQEAVLPLTLKELKDASTGM